MTIQNWEQLHRSLLLKGKFFLKTLQSAQRSLQKLKPTVGLYILLGQIQLGKPPRSLLQLEIEIKKRTKLY